METYIIILALLGIFLLYLLIWSLKLHSMNKRKKRVKQAQELRAKGNVIKKRTIDCTKDYWYNIREIEDCKEGEDFEKYYHYFIGIDQGVQDLLLEMYDCGIVRTDELEEIAYGKNHIRNVDLSFLEELEREMGINQHGENIFDPKPLEQTDTESVNGEEAAEEENVQAADDNETKESKKRQKHSVSVDEDVIQVEGAEDPLIKDGIVAAAKNLKKDDPGITDIHGTLSDGLKNVIDAVDTERKKEEEKEEPILPKKEKSVEEARAVRARTTNADVRKKIYEKWVGYVFQLYETVNINANEDTKHKIRKALMDYGYNDIDVLLDGPE